MDEPKPVSIHNGHVVFRYLTTPDLSLEERLVGVIVINKVDVWRGFKCSRTQPEKLAELSGLTEEQVWACLDKMAARNWLHWRDKSGDPMLGYIIPEERLEETREKQREYRAKIRQAQKEKAAARSEQVQEPVS